MCMVARVLHSIDVKRAFGRGVEEMNVLVCPFYCIESCLQTFVTGAFETAFGSKREELGSIASVS
jgi:hypothetical protein